MQIPILLSERLREILKANNQDPDQYGPAYQGESAGLDLWYCGSQALYPDVEQHVYRDGPNGNGAIVKFIETGLRICIPTDHVGLIQDRGSICKASQVRRSGVIDAGYTDEVFVNLVPLAENFNDIIDPGDKLPVQIIVVPVINQFKPISEKEFTALTVEARRKTGKVGSSN